MLSCYEFGDQLISTLDLDPVYCLLWEAQLDRPDLLRWLIAYWSFYHMGTASWIADKPDEFWTRMETAAGSKDWPRCHERRHFRGKAASSSVEWLKNKGLDYLFQPLLSLKNPPIAKVMEWVKTWQMFGPWIAFKVADMLERLELVNVQPDSAAIFLFDSPKKGASDLWMEEKESAPLNGEANQWAIDRILQELGHHLAPPRFERPINVMEAETICCKHHAYRGCHYHVGEDIDSCKKGLLRFPRCRLSQKLLQAGRKAGLWWPLS